ncbi:MAG: PA14 domain-containing protein [Anaerolineae bacterium]
MSWKAQYYAGTKLGGRVLAERVEASIDISKADDLPQEVKGIAASKFSARWTKSINGPGTFRFNLTSDDGMTAKVDGRSFHSINRYTNQKYEQTIKLTAGPHEVIVEFFNSGGPFYAIVSYEKIGGQDAQDIQQARQAVNAAGPVTRGGLQPARIYEVDDEGEPVNGSRYGIMYCSFNPKSYKIKKTSSFIGKGLDDDKNYAKQGEKTTSKPRELTLKEIWFDSSEPEIGQPYEDVSKEVEKLIEFAETTAAKYEANFQQADTAKAPPPKIAFMWGRFRFLGVITSVKVKYTLFSANGIPLRAKVGLKLKEFRHRRVYPAQNPTSGSDKLERLWQVQQGERLDLIAAEVYDDATRWRMLAQHNEINDPLTIRPGQWLKIPAM